MFPSITTVAPSHGAPRDACDLRLQSLAPSLTRYHSGVLGESAGVIALGLGARCLGLPDWLSLASWKQEAKGFPLPCDGLRRVPLEVVPTDEPPTALVYSHWDERFVRQPVNPAWAAPRFSHSASARHQCSVYTVRNLTLATLWVYAAGGMRF